VVFCLGLSFCLRLFTYCLLILSSSIELTLHRHKSAPEGFIHREPGCSGLLREYSFKSIAFGIRPAHSLAVEMMLTSILLLCLDAHPFSFVIHIKQNKKPKGLSQFSCNIVTKRNLDKVRRTQCSTKITLEVFMVHPRIVASNKMLHWKRNGDASERCLTKRSSQRWLSWPPVIIQGGDVLT
jgi:hypothetical protein